MTVDREQTRRDAEEALAWLGTHQHDPTHDRRLASQGYRDALALLAELEQAERERDGERTRVKFLTRALADAEARLAAVPALVEAARHAYPFIHVTNRYGLAAATELRESLSVFEQTQGDE